MCSCRNLLHRSVIQIRNKIGSLLHRIASWLYRFIASIAQFCLKMSPHLGYCTLLAFLAVLYAVFHVLIPKEHECKVYVFETTSKYSQNKAEIGQEELEIFLEQRGEKYLLLLDKRMLSFKDKAWFQSRFYYFLGGKDTFLKFISATIKPPLIPVQASQAR